MTLPLLLRVVARVAPPHAREAFVGDLLEEAGLDADPAARLRREARRSLPGALSWRIGWEVAMNGVRWLGAVVILVIGLAQAWDSGVFASTVPVQVIALSAVALLAASPLVFGAAGPRFALIAAAGLLTVIARAVAPSPLPELTLIILPAVFLAVVLAMREKQVKRPEGPKAA